MLKDTRGFHLLAALALVLAAGCKGTDDTSPCDGIGCGEHGDCAVVDGRATCLCDEGYTPYELGCVTDPCTSSPCVHGTCTPDGTNAICTCDAGYSGALCDTCAPGYHAEGLLCVAGSPCEDDPCVYGVCRSVGGEPVCDCYTGYSGTYCDECAAGYHPENLRCVSDTACDPDPCVHGACTEEDGTATCTCDTGYSGDYCDDCATGYHEEGLICVPDVGGPCDPNPCTEAHRTVCREDPGDAGYACECDPGYHETAGVCVEDTACAPNPCTETNRSDCRDDGSGGHLCLCDSGYHEEDGACVADTACTPNPCQEVHRTVCQDDGGGSHSCLCDAGYHDEAGVCVADSACSPNPCQEAHKTVCREEAGGGHSCHCDAGYHDDGTGLCVVDTICDPATTCSGHGTCGTGLECNCAAGYGGEHCEICAAGYHRDAADQCVADTACDPNPCTTLHKTVCQDDGGSATCLCDAGYQDQDGDGSCLPDCATAAPDCGDHGHCEVRLGQAGCMCDPEYSGDGCTDCADGYQDNDGNGTCSATCATAGLDCGAQVCDDSTGTARCVAARACETVVTHDPGGQTITALYIRGEFNDWALTHRFDRQPDGTYRIAIADLGAGDYGYKLYDQGRDSWFEDPGNPYYKWVEGQRNSRLRVADCDLPVLELVAPPVVSGGDISFQVRYVDGNQAAGVNPAAVEATRNDVAMAGVFDAGAGLLTVSDTGLQPGKYAYRFRASDQAGRAAARLYVPLWVETTPFQWEDAVLYFVLTDRFANGDAGNDSPSNGVELPANWQGGDFAGLLQQIEGGYFDDLGVNALWISSISMNTQGSGLGSDGKIYSGYHSYWPISTGWRDDNTLPGVQPVDPHFGELADFKQLVEAAHDRGIRVLVDFVANHVHTDSPLWQQHEHGGWFHDLYVCGWDQPISCWFAPYLPDFEYKNLDVMNTVIEHAIWMIQETDIDGFRLDAVKHMIHDFSYALRARIDESVTTTDLRFYMVGETFTGEDGSGLIKEYVRPEELDGQFDFPLYWQVTKTFLREEQDFRGLESMLQWNEGYYGEWAVMSNFLGNHDVARALSHAAGQINDLWGNGSKEQGWNDPPGLPGDETPFRKLRLAWTFLISVPGIPLIYYGDEYGLPGAGDPDNRRFMQFDAELSQHQRDTLAHIKKLTAARHAHPALRYGERTELQMDGDGLFWAFGLRHANDRAVVVFNRDPGSRTREISLTGAGLLDGTVLRDAIHGGTVTASSGKISVTLAGRDSALYVTE